ARSAVPKSKIRWLPRLRILTKEPLVIELKEIIQDAFEGEVGYTKRTGGEVKEPSTTASAVAIGEKAPAADESDEAAEDTAEFVDSVDPEQEREKGKA
ncbi:hypothetical protein, partial [Brachybacterium muris]